MTEEEIVTDLVLTKFQPALDKWKSRDFLRKSFRINFNGSDMESNDSEKSCYSSSQGTYKDTAYSEESLSIYSDPSDLSSRNLEYDLELLRITIAEEEELIQLAESVKAWRQSKLLNNSYMRVKTEADYLESLFRFHLLQKEISQYSPELRNFLSEQRLNGSIKLSDLKIPHKASEVSELGCDNWYVCILQQERNVFITEPVKMTNQKLHFFGDVFYFEELGRDFEINVYIYCLSLPRKENDDKKNTSYAALQYLIPCIHRKRPSPPVETTTNPSFILHAAARITANDISATKFPLMLSIPTSPLHKHMRAVLKTSYNLDCHEHYGFLNIARKKVTSEGAILYNLYWCELNGSRLSYWRDLASREQEPLRSLELKSCKIGRCVGFARPEMGARTKTLMVEAGGERWFLHSDDLGEVKEWIVKINAVLEDIWFWEYKIADDF